MRSLLLLVTVVSVFIARSAGATVLAVSDIDGDYDSMSAWGVLGPNSSQAFRLAYPFALAAGLSYQLDEIGIAAYHRRHNNLYSVKIFSGDATPTSLVAETVQIPLPAGPDNATHAPTIYFGFAQNLQLQGGVKYWLSLASISNGEAIHSRSNNGLSPIARTNFTWDDWYTSGGIGPPGAFAVFGEVIPEPATYALATVAITFIRLNKMRPRRVGQRRR